LNGGRHAETMIHICNKTNLREAPRDVLKNSGGTRVQNTARGKHWTDCMHGRRRTGQVVCCCCMGCIRAHAPKKKNARAGMGKKTHSTVFTLHEACAGGGSSDTTPQYLRPVNRFTMQSFMVFNRSNHLIRSTNRSDRPIIRIQSFLDLYKSISLVTFHPSNQV